VCTLEGVSAVRGMDWKLSKLDELESKTNQANMQQAPNETQSFETPQDLSKNRLQVTFFKPDSIVQRVSTPQKPTAVKQTLVMHGRVWACSEMATAVVCAILLCIFGLVRSVDANLPFVQQGLAARLNIAAPFIYAAAFFVSGLHYAFLTVPRVSASLKEIDVCCMAIALAWITLVLVFDAASLPDPKKTLISDYRYASWIDAPVSAGIFVIIFFLSRSFTPSSITSLASDTRSPHELQREPLLAEEEQRESGSESRASRIPADVLEWHATLNPALLREVLPLAPQSSSQPPPQPSPQPPPQPPSQPPSEPARSKNLQQEMDRLLFLVSEDAQPPTRSTEPYNSYKPYTAASVTKFATKPTTQRTQQSSVSLVAPQPLSMTFQPLEVVQEGELEEFTARSAHAHFDPAWDWARQCLLGVLILSWVNQLALLTNGLRAQTNRATPPIAIVQGLSSAALLFSAYFEFVSCPKAIYLIGPVLWRIMAFVGVVLAIVASDGLLLPWQADL